MNRLKQLIGEGRAIVASALCLLTCGLLAPSAQAAEPAPEQTVMDRALEALAKIENPAEVYQWSALKGKLVDISDEWTKPTTLNKRTYGAPVIFTGKGPLVYRVHREVSFDGGLAAPNATSLDISHNLDLGLVSKPITIKGELRGGIAADAWRFYLKADELTLNNVLYRGQTFNVVTDSRQLNLAGTNDFSGAVMSVGVDSLLSDPKELFVTNLVVEAAEADAVLKLRRLHFTTNGIAVEVLATLEETAGFTIGKNVTLLTSEDILFGIRGATLTVNGELNADGINIAEDNPGLLPPTAMVNGAGTLKTTHFGMWDDSTLYMDVPRVTLLSSDPYRNYADPAKACDVGWLRGRPSDYTTADGKDWLYNHAIAGKACPDEAVETGVDLFFVYPTLNDAEGMTVIDGFRDIDDATMRSATTNLHYQTAVCAFVDTARCFADMAHVYAPFYRQATVGTANDCATNMQGQTVADADEKYLVKLREGPAYSDVTNALTVYFAKWNKGRKLVLAGHSQGSALLRLVMRDYFTLPENQDKVKQVICSYQIGFGVSAAEMSDIMTATGVTFAQKADDTNVIVSYNTMGEGSSGNSLLLPPDTIAINPITWSRSTDLADKDLNVGARTNVLGTTPDVIVPDLYGAQVVDSGFNRGEVIVCKELNDKVLGTNIMGTCSLHAYDYSAYWANLRANAYDRGGKLAGFAKLCTTNFPKHLCVSDATVMLTDMTSFVVDPVAGTVWIPTNNLGSATVVLVPEKGYRLTVMGHETPAIGMSIDSTSLLPNGEFLLNPNPLAMCKVEYIQRAPDYADATGKDWLFNHDIEAKRYEGEPAEDPGVDLFYLYPTSVMVSDDHCVDSVCDIEDTILRSDHGALLSWKVTGAVFGDFTHVYAPYYRQTPVDVETTVGMQPDANANMREYWYKRAPYEDVTNALTHYFTKINPDGKRPFILAGHSHGSGMLSLAMEHFFAENGRKALLKNMVACYAIGWGVSKDWEAKLNDDLDMYVATNATDAGVYVFWNTYGGPDPSAYESTLLYPTNAAPSVNPLLWTRTSDYVPASLNFGAFTADGSGAVKPGLYDASNNVARGTIVCTAPELVSQYIDEDPCYGRYSLHSWDCRAYWENIRDNALQRIETATGGKPRCGTPNDYSKDENWMVKPETADKAVDVFFLYPTTDVGLTPNLVAEIDDAMKATAWDAYQQNTMGFWSYANMYAPYYRQASMLGLQAQAGVGGLKNFCSTHVVKTDVFAALDYYFTNLNVNAKRPFILVGHSQGSCNLKIAFEEYFVGKNREYRSKMVAAYAMGFAVEKSWCENVDVQFAEEEADTGVIMTWNCEGPDATHGPVNFLTEPDDGQAINPLNWKTDATYAGIELNLGSVVKNAKGEYEWGKGNADAQLSPKSDSPYGFRPGALVVTNTTAAYSSAVLGYQSYHGNDGAFFQRNVGNNGFKRYAAFAGLVEVVTNDVPTIADTTWKVMADGAEATVSPIDGLYYAPADATEVAVVYTLDAAKAAEGYRFANGETTTDFVMKKEGGVWVSKTTKAEIESVTKAGKPTLKLGVVAQRYPWNGIVDVNYKATYWPADNKPFSDLEITIGDTVFTNAFEILGTGEVIDSLAIDMKEIAPETISKAKIKAFAYIPSTSIDVRQKVSPAAGGVVVGGQQCAWGAETEITAVPNDGYLFDGWSDGVMTQARTVTADGKVYQATFHKPLQVATLGRKQDGYPFFDQVYSFVTNGIDDASSPYKDWAANFFVSFSKKIPSRTLKLATKFDGDAAWDQSIKGDDLEADTEYELVDAGTYGDLCDKKKLDFGVWTYDNRNLDTTMTVWLKMTNGTETVKQKLAEHTFKELVKVIIRPSGVTEETAPYAVEMPVGSGYYVVTNFSCTVTDTVLTMTGLRGGETVQLNYLCNFVSNANENTTFLVMSYPKKTTKGAYRYLPEVIPGSMDVCKGFDYSTKVFNTALNHTVGERDWAITEFTGDLGLTKPGAAKVSGTGGPQDVTLTSVTIDDANVTFVATGAVESVIAEPTGLTLSGVGMVEVWPQSNAGEVTCGHILGYSNVTFTVNTVTTSTDAQTATYTATADRWDYVDDMPIGDLVKHWVGLPQPAPEGARTNTLAILEADIKLSYVLMRCTNLVEQDWSTVSSIETRAESTVLLFTDPLAKRKQELPQLPQAFYKYQAAK